MTIFDDLGVRTVINAKGPATRLSGGPMAPEVMGAMAKASQVCVQMDELQSKASEVIAAHTGAEAGYVTTGAAAALLLGTAACVARLDIGKMARLPDTRGMKDEVIMVRSQRNFYDHAVRTVGVKIVEVGLPDRYAGAGVRDAEPWEIDDAITDSTAAIYYVSGSAAKPDLSEVVEVAHQKQVPVLVDAAAQLPPVQNLRRYIDAGADLVAFSGGKAIGGPQGSGMLAGRRDLIMSAALQNLDMDILWDQWSPPAGLIDKTLLKGVPLHGIGRACKVGKETIAGFLKALDIFVSADPRVRHGQWLDCLKRIEAGLRDVNTLSLAIKNADDVERVPLLEITLVPGTTPGALDLVTRLQNGSPSINVDPGLVDHGAVIVNPICVLDHQVDAVADGIRNLMVS
jgi:L-seryl-tRNA(Ser) seleniumtransferase